MSDGRDLAGQPSVYFGQMLVAEDSYLRKLPIVLNVRQRLAFDAVVMAADIATICYCELRQIGVSLAQSHDTLKPLQFASFIGRCWTIIDQVHALGQLLDLKPEASDRIGMPYQKFRDQLEDVRFIRNKMDHLRGNLKNLSNKSGDRSPLFGSLSFIYGTNQNPFKCESINIYAGAIINQIVTSLAMPSGRTFGWPVGLFEFSAFERTLCFEDIFLNLLKIIQFVGPDLESQITKQVAARAENEKFNVEEALGSGYGAFVVRAFIQDGPDF